MATDCERSVRGLSKFIHGIHAARPRGAVAAGAFWRRLGLRSCLRRICSNRTHGARRPCTGMCTHGQSWDARARERPSPWHLLARVHTPLCSTLTTCWLQAGLRRPVLDSSQNGHSRVRAPRCLTGRTHCAGARTTTGRTAARSCAQRR